jgi:hypothetical protein
MEIINSLGSFISMDSLNLTTTVIKVARVLVKIDIHSGLRKVLEIEWRVRKTLQQLDCLGIPFRCSIFHCVGHFRQDCKGWVSMDDSEDTDLQEILYNSSLEATLPNGGHQSNIALGESLG